MSDVKPMTPEEYRWQASVHAPDNLKRKLRLQYILLGGWCAITIAWIVIVCLGIDTMSWMTVVVLLAGFFNCILGIINHKRLLKGRKELF